MGAGKQAAAEEEEEELLVEEEAEQEFAGSCTCYCKAESGRGACFNVGVQAAPTKFGKSACKDLPGIADKTNKNSFMYKQADYCSPAGTPKQCNYPADAKNSSGLCTEAETLQR